MFLHLRIVQFVLRRTILYLHDATKSKANQINQVNDIIVLYLYFPIKCFCK